MGWGLRTLASAGKWAASVLPHHRLGYWLTAAVILVATTWSLPFLDKTFDLSRASSWLFERLAQSATNKTVAGRARLVVIGDKEYWGDIPDASLTGTAYLAKVVRALDAADASVIALDFDMSTAALGPQSASDSDGAAGAAAYSQEIADLVRAIDDVAQRRRIVLATATTGPEDGPRSVDAEVYQPYGICLKLRGDGVWDNPGVPQFPIAPAARAHISCGYIDLMDDPRRVPPPVVIEGQPRKLDSFSMAVVRARDPYLVPTMTPGRRYYGEYIEKDLIQDRHITLSAHDLLADPEAARDMLQGWPVIVGAAWHNAPSGVGARFDEHETPVGPTSGVVIHENLAEAMLGGRIFPGLDSTELRVLELLVGAIAGVFFAYYESFLAKCLAIAGFMVGLLALQWMVLQLTGTFLDATPSVLTLGVHTLVDRVVGLREAAEPSRFERFITRRWRGIRGGTPGRTAGDPSSAEEGPS